MGAEFTVVFAPYPHVTQLDFTGPHEVLARLPDTQCVLASASGGDVEADGGIVFTKVRRLADLERCALICVPGGFDTIEAMEDQEFIAQIRRLAPECALCHFCLHWRPGVGRCRAPER